MAQIIDGKAIAAEIRSEVAEETRAFKETYGITPGLSVIIVGDDPASQVYVRNKRKACDSCGFASETYALPASTTQAELEALIDRLNEDETVHGILVQLPLPAHLDEKAVLLRIRPDKDVDAFHPFNVGEIMIGDYRFLPCTPAGCMELIRRSGISVEGKNCVVVGRSTIVGKPMAMLLLQANGTVTICHSRTRDLPGICRTADILVAAVGKRELIRGDMIKPGAVVIDVGINRKEDGTLCGDVAFEEAFPVAGYITPVPGGVGPMTIAMLMKNTLTAAKRAKGI